MGRSEFDPRRRTKEYRQTINDSPDNAFPLLRPVREAEWRDGCQYEMIYSQPGSVETVAVFRDEG